MKPASLKKLQPAESLDPVERYVPLGLKFLVYTFCSYYLVQAAETFIEYHPGQGWPFLLSEFRMFTFLPIHEAGHLIFRPFGTTIMFLGGSFWQIAIPLIWFAVALKQRLEVALFPLFWVGENMMDVSLYVRDAPYRALPLLGGQSVGHDWFNILTRWNALDSAESLADALYYIGLIIALGGIIAGIVLALITFFKPRIIPNLPDRFSGPPPSLEVEELLKESLERKHQKSTLE
jgi:hypothetical protein